MKIKKASITVAIFVFVIGAASGILFQKFYGFGNILALIGKIDQAKPIVQLTRVANGGNIPDDYQGKMQLFILMGQSNMSGKGDIPESQVANPRIYVFGNDYHWGLAIEPVDDPFNQVDKVSKDSAGYSPASSFAATILQQHPDMVIGLIPCAKSGSSIYEWRRSLSDNSLYGSCLKRVRAASVMGNVAGIIFFQGETETQALSEPEQILLPNQWANDFEEIINDWRSDMNLPELPVVFAQIGTNTKPDQFKNWAIVQEQQSSVQLLFCEMVTTKDLSLKDEVHFTTESYRIIGQRFAEAYLGLLKE